MRTKILPKTEGNDVQVWSVSWDHPKIKGGRTSSIPTQNKKKCEELYQKLESQGKKPILVEDWIAGWAF